jgi:hypothetical protein
MDEHDTAAHAPTTATLSPQLTALLRGALYTDMQRACEDAPATAPASSTREAWLPVLRRINADANGLDLIGWDEPHEQESVTITLDATMIQALQADADHWVWTSEQVRIETAAGRQRAAQHAAAIEQLLASLGERPAPLIIPAAAIPLVRECVHEGVPGVAEEIDIGRDLRESGRRLTAICDLLDVIGWSNDEEPTGDVDANEHASVVKEVTPSLIDTLKTTVSEADDDDPERAKAERELQLLNHVHTQACEAIGDAA